jgi:hypothetical protein
MNICWIFLVVTAKVIGEQYDPGLSNNADQLQVKLSTRKH